MQISFPKPAKIQIDNTAAVAFSKTNAYKPKLKHIDARQEWVKTLRDASLFEPVHVPTSLNLADLFTKILGTVTFKLLRERILHRVPDASA